MSSTAKKTMFKLPRLKTKEELLKVRGAAPAAAGICGIRTHLFALSACLAAPRRQPSAASRLVLAHARGRGLLDHAMASIFS